MFESYKRATNAIVGLVNRAGVGNKRAVSVLAPTEVQKKFLTAVHRAGQRSLVLGSISEASVRVGVSRMIAVGAGVSLADAQEGDLAVLDVKTDTAYTNAPSPLNTAIHKLVYRESVNQAVLLCHPRNAIKLLGQGLQPDFSILPAAQELIGRFTICQPADLSPALQAHKVILVEGIGLLSLGNSIEESINQAETLDWICWVTIG